MMKPGSQGKTTTTATSKPASGYGSKTTGTTSTTSTAKGQSNWQVLFIIRIDPKQNSKEFKDNFLKKVQFCSQIYDFNDDSKDIKEKVE